MAKLTTGQMAIALNVSSYTLKRWYEFWENLANTDVKKLNELCQNGMPALPECEKIGNRGDRIWDEEDIERLNEYITLNKATDGNYYYWYLDCDELEVISDINGNIIKVDDSEVFFGI